MMHPFKLANCLLNRTKQVISLVLCMLLFFHESSSQKEDNKWVTGSCSTFLNSFHNDTVINTHYIDTVIVPYALQLVWNSKRTLSVLAIHFPAASSIIKNFFSPNWNVFFNTFYQLFTSVNCILAMLG